MEIITVILIGLSLSMDTFSLALAYGTLNLTRDKVLFLSLLVAIFHFIMPYLGLAFGYLINYYLITNLKLIISFIFIVLGLNLIINSKQNQHKLILLKGIGFLIFSFTVSIDSFFIGIGLEYINSNYLLCCFIFAFCSYLFTYLGLKIGAKIGTKLGYYGPVLGGFILIIVGLCYL